MKLQNLIQISLVKSNYYTNYNLHTYIYIYIYIYIYNTNYTIQYTYYINNEFDILIESLQDTIYILKKELLNKKYTNSLSIILKTCLINARYAF